MQEKEFIKTKVGEAIFKKVQEDTNFKPIIFEVNYLKKWWTKIYKKKFLFKVSVR